MVSTLPNCWTLRRWSSRTQPKRIAILPSLRIGLGNRVFLGLKIESLSVEASGHFNVQSYLDLEDAPGSGYDAVAYTVHLSVPGATPEQIAYLRERCEHSSPVGDSLARAIPLKLEFKANT